MLLDLAMLTMYYKYRLEGVCTSIEVIYLRREMKRTVRCQWMETDDTRVIFNLKSPLLRIPFNITHLIAQWLELK